MELPAANVRTLCELNSSLYSAPVGSKSLTAPACPDIDLRRADGAAPDLSVAHVRCPGGQWPPAYNTTDGTWTGPQSAGAPFLATLKSWTAAFDPSSLPARLGALASPSAPSQSTDHPHGSSLAWHPGQPLLAAADASDGVQLFDMSTSLPSLGQPTGPAPAPLSPHHTLKHELQRNVAALAWRPNAGVSLAVGGGGGVCMWALGKGGAASGGGSAAGGHTAGMTWLHAPSGGTVTALAWHPRGRMLAGAGPGVAGMVVWDVATGTLVPLRAGLAPVSLLRWSPCGLYLLAGHPDGAFRLWETASWWSAKWQGAGGSPLITADWAPDSRSLLLVHGSSASMLHLTSEWPGLTAHVLPVVLPGLPASSNNDGESTMVAAAWDGRGKRLAVALRGSGAPCVALYDARCDPLFTARLIGVMRVGLLTGAGAVTGEDDWEMVEGEIVAGGSGCGDDEGYEEEVVGRTKREVAREGGVQLAFHNKFAPGALLAVREGISTGIATVPMFFAS